MNRKGPAPLGALSTATLASSSSSSNKPTAPADAEAEADALLAAERKAEADLAEEQRLLNAAIEDFTRIIPAEEPQNELPCVVLRATCYMYLGTFDKAQADFKLAGSVLDTLKGEDALQASFGGSSAAILQEILAIRKPQLAAMQQRERRGTSGAALESSTRAGPPQ